VYAFSDDLAQWMETRRNAEPSAAQPSRNESESVQVQVAPVVIVSHAATAVSAALDQAAPAESEPLIPLEPSKPTPSRRAWVLFGAGLVFAAAVAFVVINHQRVTASLSKPTSDVRATNVSHHVPGPAAQDLYLKGRYYWNKRTPADLNKALDYFTQSIVNDPNYALAYVGLADCFNLLREYSVMPEEEAYPRAMAAARKAIELDNSLAEAHNSLAFGTYYWSMDVAGAEREFRKALALDPNCALAHHWYATFLINVGRNQEALQQIELARQLDSSSTSILADKALLLYYSGRREEGVALLKQINETEPSFLSTHRYLAIIDLVNQNYSDYLVELRKVGQLSQNQTDLAIVSAGEKALHAGGPRAMLESMFRMQKQLLAEGRIPAYRLAMTCALLGQNEQAFAYLHLARERHESLLSGIVVDPTLVTLRADPAYRELLSEIGLPPPHASEVNRSGTSQYRETSSL
jgi:tetratricopeptide (TPR) repeat protein